MPRVVGDRLYGRGAYDMKGGLAAMMCALRDVADQRPRARALPVRVRRGVRGGGRQRGSDYLVAQGYSGDFAITGEPTDLHIGVQAKGVLVLRIEVTGTSAHGSTPWIGDNAVVKAIDVFRQIESLPFARESSDLFDRPSINLGRIAGGDAINRVPDACVIDVDMRYLPGQDPEAILAAINDLEGTTATKTFHRHPVMVDRENPFVQALGAGICPGGGQEQRADLGGAARRLRRHGVPRRGRARRWSAGPPGAAITAPRNGCRSGRSASIGSRSWSS